MFSLQLLSIASKQLCHNKMDFPFLIKDPDKRVKALVKKITHSGETELDKESLVELKNICKRIENDIVGIVFKECMKCLAKEHSQVRVSSLKLIDYLFQKSHVIREKVLDNFDTFLELTLAISNKPKVKLKLPPPKKFAALLQELTAKTINSWHSDFGQGYEKLRYAYKFLREHQLVDFSAFRVRTHEDLIKRQKLAERQEKILSRNIENRLKELQTLRPEIDELVAQIESLIDLLTGSSSLNDNFLEETKDQSSDHEEGTSMRKEQFGIIANLSQSVEIEFSPYIEVSKNGDNRELVENLRELKKQLVENKLPKLVAIERTLIKRSEEFVRVLKEIIDLKSKATNVVLKLSELKIITEVSDESKQNSSKTLDSISDSDSEFEDVAPKEGLESYIPKSMRFEYGLEAIDPRELDGSKKTVLVDECFIPEPSNSGSSSGPIMPCNVRLDSGKLCPRKDKFKCPFHGRIIPRDHKGVPLNEQDRIEEERLRAKPIVPDWQDPELLRDLKAATGVDLTMPTKGRVQKSTKQKKLANTRTCDLTPKQRLQKRLKLLTK